MSSGIGIVLRGLGYGLGYLVFLAVAALALSLVVTWVRGLHIQERPKARLAGNSTSDARRLRARMNRMAQPTLLLTPAKEPGFSKLGGDPELPPGIEWPAGADGHRAFLAQIDLGTFRAHGGPEWLPETGRLYAFCDDQGYGDPRQVRVVFSLETPGAPAGPSAGTKRFPERRVAFETYTSIPSLDWLGVDVREIEVEPDELDELADAPNAAFGDELQHRIGGYPSEIQEEQMAITCERYRRGEDPHNSAEPTPAVVRAARQWRLLLQIDSDPALKMNWGDGGMLYVFVRERDALAQDFSRTVTISQTY